MSLRLAARQALGNLAYGLRDKRPQPNTLSILMYHSVTRKNLRDLQQQTVPVDLFGEQLDTVRELGVRFVSLEEGLRALKQGRDNTPMAAVVFDDGYVGVHDLAMKELVQRRIPATLFLATQLIGQTEFLHQPSAWGRPLKWPEVETLVRDGGMTLGSHGHTHRIFSHLSQDQMRQELRDSRREIERVQPGCRLFAYPYGAAGMFNSRTRQAIEEEGFVAACTALWGRCAWETDPLQLPRMRISWCDTPAELKKALCGAYDWYAFFQRFRL